MKRANLIIENCDQIVQVCSNMEPIKKGHLQDNIAIIERRNDGIGCSIVIGNDGLIKDIGYDDEIVKMDSIKVLNGFGCSVIPGLIDCHTHPIWSGDRVFEFELKTKGLSYLDIHQKGGGIYYTVEKTRVCSENDLLRTFLERLDNMLRCGTTVVECKTGYGLELNAELKMLNVIEKAKTLTKLDLVTTFLGAHAIPKGMTPEEGVQTVIEMIKHIGSSKHNIEFIDVFCEKGVYDIEQTREILLNGKRYLQAIPAFHGDELNGLGAAELSASVCAKSVSHLEYISDEGIKAMAANDIVAIICPTTQYLMKLRSAPVRNMIDQNVAIAIGTDFNPNAYCYSLATAMNIAVVNSGLTLNEALTATTINAAFALNRSNMYGSLEVGKCGDCVVIDANDWRNIIYQLGDSSSLVKYVVKRGNILKSGTH